MTPTRTGPAKDRCLRARSPSGAWGRRLAVLWLSVAAWFWSSTAWAGNPDLRWRTIETEHFFVHYAAGNEEAAERTAMVSERAYDDLAVAWGHDVFLRTHILLTDGTDTANGSATANPFPLIRAFTTAPESLSVLEAYDDWLDILLVHEMVHVMHLDTVHGLSRAVNAVLGFGVLGKVNTPNVVQPRWVVEGVATVHESQYSSQGRRRSAQFDAFIRMAVLDRSFQALDQISSGARVFPHGTSVYLYGLHFMYYLNARYGPDKLRDLSHIYATQIVPYGINRAIEKVVGVTFFQLWKEFKEYTVAKYQAQARRIRSRGLRQGRRMTFAGETTRYPMWSPDDGYIYFYKADGHREEGLKRLRATGGRLREGLGIGRQGVDVDIEHVIDVEDAGQSSFIGATGDVVFDMTRNYDFRYRWSDLYRHNGGDPKISEQLTFGKRASEPNVSPDGRTVAFRRNDVAQSRLGFLDLASGDVTEVAPQGKISQVFTPRWAPDGRRVAFSGWREGGFRDIYVFDRESGTTERITADRHMDVTPTWSPDGRYIVFSSDRDQVFNIHAYDTVDGSVRQVSNVLGGAFDPAISHDGKRIAYVGYGRAGYDLWVMDFDPEQWLDAMPPTSDLPLARNPRPAMRGFDKRVPSLKSKRYGPWRTFFPRTIFPTALDFQSADFASGLGFELGIVDVMGFHDLLGTFNYNIAQRQASGRVSYVFRRLFPNFAFSLLRDYSNRGGFSRYLYDREEFAVGSQDDRYVVTGYQERRTSASVSTDVPVLSHPRHSASVGAGYTWTRWENLDRGQAVVDPNAPATRFPEVGDATSVSLSATYSSLGDGSGRFTYATETGRRINVSLNILDEHLGGDFGDIQASGTYREIIPMPWRGHQSLNLRFRGGASAGGLSRRGAFCIGDFTYGADAIRSVLARQGFGTGCAMLLRGFPGRGNPDGQPLIVGRYYAGGSAEYRIPLLDVDRGVGTMPLFFQRVGLIPFVDVGNAWTDLEDARDLKVGVGGSLLMSLRLGYAETVHVLLQFAHGFGDRGTDTFRAVISANL